MVIILSNILKAQKGVLPERVSIRLPFMVKLVPLDNIGQCHAPQSGWISLKGCQGMIRYEVSIEPDC